VDELVLSGGRVLGERAPGNAEHLVAGLEPGHLGADRHDRAGHVQPGDALLGTTEPEADDSHQVGPARHLVPGAPVHTGPAHLHQDLVGGDVGPVDLCQMQHVGGAVGLLHDGSHDTPPRSGAP
jgi:hypothetical protein